MSTEKRGRTAVTTIDDLLSSKRFQLAVEFFEHDPMLMKAILVELTMEAARVQKTALVKVYSTHYGLDKKEMLPLLKNCDQGNSWNVYWGLTQVETMLYSIDPLCKKSKHERIILLDQIQKSLEPTVAELQAEQLLLQSTDQDEEE